MSAQTEAKRVGPFVLVRTDYDGEEDRPEYAIYTPSRTDEHGCTGCWHDADGVGYCEETAWYSALLGGGGVSYYGRTNPQDLAIMEALMDQLNATLPPAGPPPPTEANHFL